MGGGGGGVDGLKSEASRLEGSAGPGRGSCVGGREAGELQVLEGVTPSPGMHGG